MINSENELEEKLSNAFKKIKLIGGDKVLFIILYGSYIKGQFSNLSDIDIAVYYKGNKEERFDFRVNLYGELNKIYDIQIFQDLPLYIQNEIISTGKIIYQKSFDEIFNIFIKVIKDFNNFKPRLKIIYSDMGV